MSDSEYHAAMGEFAGRVLCTGIAAQFMHWSTKSYAAHKALSPVRFPPTVALTPVVARWLGRKPAQEGE